MARVEAVLRRFGKDTQSELVAGQLSINATTRTIYLSGKELELTRREYDLLYYLMVNRNLTFSREQLLNNVWGYDFEGSMWWHSALSPASSTPSTVWVAVAGLLVPDFIYNIGTTVLNGGVSMVIFFFVNKIIFPESGK